jgi:hypothetical protein
VYVPDQRKRAPRCRTRARIGRRSPAQDMGSAGARGNTPIGALAAAVACSVCVGETCDQQAAELGRSRSRAGPLAAVGPAKANGVVRAPPRRQQLEATVAQPGGCRHVDHAVGGEAGAQQLIERDVQDGEDRDAQQRLAVERPGASGPAGMAGQLVRAASRCSTARTPSSPPAPAPRPHDGGIRQPRAGRLPRTRPLMRTRPLILRSIMTVPAQPGSPVAAWNTTRSARLGGPSATTTAQRANTVRLAASAMRPPGST